jgi:hypothetical protein
MKDNSLNQMTKRTAGYWYVDGLAELGTGFLFLVLGGFYLVMSRLQPGGITALAVGIGQPLIIILGVYGVSRLVRFFKERITYPRTGYVSYRQKPQSVRRKKAMMAGMVAAVLAVLVTLLVLDLGEATIWLVAGVLGALVPVMFGYRLGVPRFYLIAALMVGLSVAIYLLPARPDMNEAVLFYSGLGVIVTGSGLVTLLRYLHTTRLEAEAQDE